MLCGHSILRPLTTVALMCIVVALASASAEAKKRREEGAEE